MQELLKKKQEIDRLYREAKNMEFTVDTAAQNTIDNALIALDAVIEQVGDDFGAFYAGIVGWVTLSRSGTSGNLRWSLQVSPPRMPEVMWFKCSGRWTGRNCSVQEKMAAAEVIMYYWPKFMENVQSAIEKRIKADMQKELNEIGRMVDFLQKAEKFTV